jgi:DNA replicative helicase MCM subunit Mcm2 (Cdc46/Mcm family)
VGVVLRAAPSIWGCEDIKKGLLCMLFGGVNPAKIDHGSKIRHGLE